MRSPRSEMEYNPRKPEKQISRLGGGRCPVAELLRPPSGTLTVNLGGAAAPLVLGIAGVPTSFTFGSTTANSETEFVHAINLNGKTLALRVDNNVDTAGDFATFSGVLSNGALSKSGFGTVALTGFNTHTGATSVSDGAVRARDGLGLPTASNLCFSGHSSGGTGVWESEGPATFTRGLGTGAGQVQWTGTGGFSAHGGKLTVAIGGTASPTPLTWGSGNFVPAYSALVFGSTTADSETEFMNSIDLAGAARTVSVIDNPFSAGDFATLSGTLSNRSLVKDGPGLLVLKGSHTYTGASTVLAGTLELAAGAALASTTFDVKGGARLDLRDLVGGLTLGAGKSIKGGGTVLGDLVVGGKVAPGESPGILSVGNVRFASGGTLEIELGGTVRGTGYDVLASSGNMVLQEGSALVVTLVNSFIPDLGDQFDILDFAGASGHFTTIDLPPLGSGLSWDTGDLYTSGTISVAPEPAAVLLLALGGLAVVARRRGRK